MLNNFLKNKNGQVTIFIILGILIVVSVVAFFVLSGRFNSSIDVFENPQLFIEKCVGDSVENSASEILLNGGRIVPENYKLYQGEKYNFLCFQQNFYLPCVNTHPMLVSISEAEIKNNIRENVVNCFDELKKEIENSGYETDFEEIIDEDWKVEILPRKISVEIERQISISGKGSSRILKNFEISVISPLYEFENIAREIVNQESQYCNFEYNGFMLLYPEYNIKRISYDNVRIYKITERSSGLDFKFAIRGCVIPESG